MPEARPIPGWPGYEVDDDGRVWSANWPGRGRYELRRRPDDDGYLRVRLAKNGGELRMFVHQLVLLTFVGERPIGQQSRHLNGDPADNRRSNLAYGTPAQNAADRKAHGRTYGGERHHNAAKTHCPQNHELTPENTYVTPSGKRECRTCKRARTNKGRK